MKVHVSKWGSLFLIALLSCVLAACGDDRGKSPKEEAGHSHDDHAGHDHDHDHDHEAKPAEKKGSDATTGSTSAVTSEANCPHGIAKAKCPFCDPALIEKLGWCKEHDVAEALCTRCRPALIPAFKAKNDWCAEHNLPESQCTICNPQLKKDKTQASVEGVENGATIQLTAEAVKTHGIRVAPVKKHALSQALVAPARVVLNQDRTAHVGAPLSGRVADLRVNLGSTVKKGDVLFQVDSPDLGLAQSEFLLKRATAAALAPAIELAQSAHQRAKTLHEESQGISLTEVQKREAEWKTAQAAWLAADAERLAAENRLHLLGMNQDEVRALAKNGEIVPRYPVRALLDGQVIEREVTLGEMVNPDRDALLVVADLSTVWVMIDVPEIKLHAVKVGDPVWLEAPARPGQVFETTVSFIVPKINATTRTAAVRVDAPGGDGYLLPGMFARARITPRAAQGAVLAVPDEAVQTIEGVTSVFIAVPGAENAFAQRVVKTGPTVAGFTPILAGLQENESVVVANSFIFKADLGKSHAGHGH